MEQTLIRKIKGAMMGIKIGSKTPKDANVGLYLNKLKDLNQPMYDQLLSEYKTLLETIKK